MPRLLDLAPLGAPLREPAVEHRDLGTGRPHLRQIAELRHGSVGGLADGQKMRADVAFDRALDLDVAGGFQVALDRQVRGQHRCGRLRLGRACRKIVRGLRCGLGGLLQKKEGGALEVVGRFSKVDLNDRELRGGELTNVSVGLNWYLSSSSIVKLNYINSSVEDRGRVNIVLLRYQYRPLPIPGWR